GAEIGRLGVDGRSRELRRKLQMVFQNPDSTLNPSHTVGYAISRALRRLRDRAPADPSAGVARLLEVVKLAPQMAARKPRQLSGGEKHRGAALGRPGTGPRPAIRADPAGGGGAAREREAARLSLRDALPAEAGRGLRRHAAARAAPARRPSYRLSHSDRRARDAADGTC